MSYFTEQTGNQAAGDSLHFYTQKCFRAASQISNARSSPLSYSRCCYPQSAEQWCCTFAQTPPRGLAAPQVSCSAAPHPVCLLGGGSCCFSPVSPKYISGIDPKLGKARVCASPGSDNEGHNLSPTRPCSAPPPSRHSLPSLWLFTGINKLLSVSSASPQGRSGTFSEVFMRCKGFSTSCCNPAVSFQLCTTPTSLGNFPLFHFLNCHPHNLLGYRFSSHHTTIQSQGLSVQSLKSPHAHLDRFLGAFTPDPVLRAQSRLCTTCKCSSWFQ